MSAETPPLVVPRALSLSPDELKLISDHLKLNPKDLFHVPNLCALLAMSRLAKVGTGSVRVLESVSEAVIENTIEHNLKGLTDLKALERPRFLINVLASIYPVYRRAASLKVLSVGPRTEAEILALLGAGFVPNNIHGLDLMSYSEFVDLGDMHAMPYGDATFDVVILGWVLGYSTDCATVAAEVRRVARPGAYVAIGVERNPRSAEELAEEAGYALDGTEFDNTGEILDLFKDHVAEVPFRHDVPDEDKDEVGHVMTVFRLT